MNKCLTIKNLSFAYPQSGGSPDQQGQMILSGLSLEVERNSLYCILGPSGCGKSTLLKLVSAMLKPSSGEITIDGKRVDKPDTERIIIFQDDDQLFPWLDVVENIALPLKLKKDGSAREKALKLAEDVNLGGYTGYFPHELSGGMKKRAAIARGLSTGPRILLMDEPFGSLDTVTKARLHSLVLDIWKKKKLTIIFVTHDIHEAIYLATDIAVMDSSGKIRETIKNHFTGIKDFSAKGFADFYSMLCRILDENQ